MHGRSRMTIDPFTSLYHAETEHVGFSPSRQTLLAPSAKRRAMFGESNKGWTASFEYSPVRRTSAPCAYFLAYG